MKSNSPAAMYQTESRPGHLGRLFVFECQSLLQTLPRTVSHAPFRAKFSSHPSFSTAFFHPRYARAGTLIRPCRQRYAREGKLRHPCTLADAMFASPIHPSQIQLSSPPQFWRNEKTTVVHLVLTRLFLFRFCAANRIRHLRRHRQVAGRQLPGQVPLRGVGRGGQLRRAVQLRVAVAGDGNEDALPGSGRAEFRRQHPRRLLPQPGFCFFYQKKRWTDGELGRHGGGGISQQDAFCFFEN